MPEVAVQLRTLSRTRMVHGGLAVGELCPQRPPPAPERVPSPPRKKGSDRPARVIEVMGPPGVGTGDQAGGRSTGSALGPTRCYLWPVPGCGPSVVTRSTSASNVCPVPLKDCMGAAPHAHMLAEERGPRPPQRSLPVGASGPQNFTKSALKVHLWH